MTPILANVVCRWKARRALQEKVALRQRTFLQMMAMGGTMGIVSAYQGGSSKKDNQVRHGELMADLQKLGYHKINTLKGQWEGVAEKALLIPRIRPEHLFMLGEKYKQDSTIYKSADGVVGMYYHKARQVEVAIDPQRDPVFEMAQDQGLYSKDRNWSFSLGFLWGQKIPWNGREPISRKEVSQLIQHGQITFTT